MAQASRMGTCCCTLTAHRTVPSMLSNTMSGGERPAQLFPGEPWALADR